MPLFVTLGAAMVQGTLFAIVFLGASVGIGRRVTVVVGIREQGSSLGERVVISSLLGAGTLQFLPFALGVAGVLSTSNLRLVFALAVLASLPDLWTTLVRVRLAFNDWSKPPVWVWWWIVSLLPGLAVALLLASTPTLDPDGLGYHLTVPKRWLLSGSLGYLPGYPYSNTPMGVEMLFMTGLAVAGDAAAKLVHFTLGISGTFGLYLAGKRLHGRALGAASASLFLYGPLGCGTLIGCAYLEAAISAALIAASLAWLVWYRERDRAWLACAALLAGVGASFKITAGLFVVALGVLTFLFLIKQARAARESAWAPTRTVVGLLPLLAAPVLPWLIRSAVETGNPVFPIAATLIPSRDFSAGMAAKFERYNRYMTWGSSLGPSWTLDRRKLFFVAVALAFALVGSLVVSRQRSYAARSTAAVIVGTLLVQLVAVGLYKRYWGPLFAVAQLPLLLVFARQLSARWAPWLLIGLTTLGSLFYSKQSLKTVNYDLAGLVKTALGLGEQRAFLLHHMPLFPIYEEANKQVPPPTRIGLSDYCGGFYLDQPTFCADIAQESLRYTSWPLFVSDLKRLKMTHFIAPRAWAVPGSKPNFEQNNTAMIVREGEHACVGRLLREHARLVASADLQGLYVIDRALLN